MALTDLTRISTSGIATGSTIDSPILRKDVDFRGDKVGVTSALFDSSEKRLDFKDNVKLRFGDSGDLSLYHEPNNSFIKNTTGQLALQTPQWGVQGIGTEGYNIYCIAGQQIQLYYAGNKKFETTSTGVVVTGILTATSFSGGGGISAGVVTCTGLDLNGNGDVSGNFVIGGDLTVNGTTTTLDTNLTEVDRIEVGANSNTIVGVAITQSGTADIVNLFDGTSQVVTVDDEGNVGLGLTNPTNKLQVANGHINLSAGYSIQWNDSHERIEQSDGKLEFFTANGEKMTLSGDNLGIGTDNPSRKLDLHENSSSGNFISITNDTTGHSAADGALIGLQDDESLIISNKEDNHIEFHTDNDEQLRITSAGLVGIGTDNPDYGLHVYGAGDILVEDSGNGSAHLRMRSSNNGSDVSNWKIKTSSNNHFYIENDTVGGTSQFTINDSGNMGLAVNEPRSRLDVFETTTGNQTAIRIGNSNTPSSANDKRLEFVDGVGTTEGTNKYTYGYIQGFRSAASNAGDLIFGTKNNNAGAPTEKLRITSAGKVGINSTSPTYALEVDGGTQNTVIALRSTDAKAAISFLDNTSGGYGRATIGGEGDEVYITSGAGVEALRITSGGTITIPGQGASNANPRLLIEDGTGGSNDFSISQYEDANGTYTLIGQNVQLDGNGNETILDSNHKTASIYLDARNNGAIFFNTGGTNAHTESLRITSDGDVLFSGLSTKNDPRNAKGIAIKSPAGVSFQNFGANGSRNWRIRPDDLVDWGTLEFSVSPTDNSATDWPDAATDVVLTLKPDKNVLVNNGSIEANDNTLSAISKTASSDTYKDIFVYDTRKDSDGGAWRHRTTNTSWYNETLNTSDRGARREFPQVAIVAVGNSFIHIFDADDPDMPMWMQFNHPSGGARNVMYGTGNPRCVFMLNGILCTGSQATNYWPVLIDFIRDDIIGLRDSGGHLHYNGRQGVISLRNSATSDSGKWWPSTLTGGPNGGGRVAKRWWFDGNIVNNHVTSVVMDVRPEAPIDKTTGMQIPTIYLGTRGGVSIIHSNSGDTGTSYNSAFYDITSNNAPYSAIGDITITEEGFLWAFCDSYNSFATYRDSVVIDLKRLDNQMNDIVTRPDTDTIVSGLNNQAGGTPEKGREYYGVSTGNEAGTHRIGYNNTWAANILERNAWGCAEGFALHTKPTYYFDHKESGNFLPNSDQNRGLVAMITKDYNTGWHMTGTEISSCYIADGLTTNIPAGAGEMLDRGHKARQIDVVGGLTRAKCATGSDLSCVSGFSANNYARIINQSINGGNPIDITMMGWIKLTDIGGYSYLCSISNGSDNMGIAIHSTSSTYGGYPYFYDSQHGSLYGDKSVHDGEWHHVCGVFSCNSNRKILYIDGQRSGGFTAPSNKNYSDLDVIAVGHWCGTNGTDVQHSCRGSLALVKIGLSDLTDQQIKRIYEDEKKLLQPNAKAFLYGSSNSITAIGYDEKKEIYHVGTSSGRSDFSGLSRINNTTTAVTDAISAYDGLIAEQ